MVPYSGNHDHKLLSKDKLQEYQLSTKFPVKGKTDFQHKNNVVYHTKCTSQGCHENYIGGTNRRIAERIQDHNNRDKNSHLLKHAREKGHTHVCQNNFRMLG